MEQRANEVFPILNGIDCNNHTEEKSGLTYLPWAWAWAEVKKAFPAAYYTIYENADGWNYHTDGRTAWVKTGVTIEGLELIEYLPVMDYRNKSIPLNEMTSFDVNKAIQRSLTKACARHGLGLYIYAGEDLPEFTELSVMHDIEETTNLKKLCVLFDNLKKQNVELAMKMTPAFTAKRKEIEEEIKQKQQQTNQ